MTFPSSQTPSAAVRSEPLLQDRDTSQPAQSTIEATSLTPPLIEPMDPPPAPPAEPQPGLLFAHRNDAAPAFPQEPVPGGKGWIKWAILALVIAAIASGALMASRMKGLSSSGSNIPSMGNNAISPEDKAKADALVGPQGSSTSVAPAQAPEDQVLPATPSDITADSAVTLIAAPEPPGPTVQMAAPTLTPPPPAPSSHTPSPPPSRAPSVKRNAPPSLDDLLD